MTRHLSDRQILDAQFRLADESEARRVAEHLAACPACRERDDQLRHKFASMSVLRETPPASEQLVAETLRRIRRARPEPRTAMPWTSWLWGTAAVAAAFLAIVYIGPLLTRRSGVGALAMREPAAEVAVVQETRAPAERPLEMAMVKDQEIAAAAPLPEEKEMEAADALNTPHAMDLAQLTPAPAAPEARLRPSAEPTEGAKSDALMLGAAMERGVAGGGGYAAAALREGLKARKAQAPSEPEVPWAWEAPPQVQVAVRSVLAGFDNETLQTIEQTGRAARQWQITIVNEADEHAEVRLIRPFPSAEWTMRVANDAVAVMTQGLTRAVVFVDVPPGGQISFLCTEIAGAGAGARTIEPPR